MKSEIVPELSSKVEFVSNLRSSIMVALTVIFVLLYGAALMGWIKPMIDERVVARLEPIILIIIGYYFGRLPAQQNEQSLKNELNRQIQKADAAQHAKEQAQQTRETLEEKFKNVRIVLSSSASSNTAKSLAGISGEAAIPAQDAGTRLAIKTALGILSS